MSRMKHIHKLAVRIAMIAAGIAFVNMSADAQLPTAAKVAITIERTIKGMSHIKPNPIPPIGRFPPRPIKLPKDSLKFPKPVKMPKLPERIQIQELDRQKHEKRIDKLNKDYGKLRSNGFASDTLAAVRIAERAAKLGVESIAVDCICRFAEIPPTTEQLAYAVDSLMIANWSFRRPLVENRILANYIASRPITQPIKPGDARFETYMEEQALLTDLAEKHCHSFVPLAMIPSNLHRGDSITAPLYYDAIKAIIKYPNASSSEFQQTLCVDGSYTMLGGGMDSAMLQLFELPSLAKIASNSFPLAWNLYVAAFCRADQRGDKYYDIVRRINPAATDSLTDVLYSNIIDLFIEEPNKNSAEYIISNSAEPLDLAYVLCDTLIIKMPLDDTYEKITPEKIEQLRPYSESIITMVDMTVNDSLTGLLPDIMRIYRAVAYSLLDDDRASKELHQLTEHCIAHRHEKEYAVLIPGVAICYGSDVADGLDNPNAGLKILKHYLKYAETEGIDAETRIEYYNYMAAMYDRLGDKKKASKCRAKADLNN